MSDSFVVLNPTHNQITLVFEPPFTMQDELHMSKHKRRRKVRGGITTVTFRPNSSIDLVERTGFDSEHLEKNKDLQMFVKAGILQDMRDLSRETVKESVEEVEEVLPQEENTACESCSECPGDCGSEEETKADEKRVKEVTETKEKPKRKKRGRRSKKTEK
ncbi:hypothetical protein N8Z24_00040 [bacterium]|nr:hypothetical protein [bacterium]